MTIRKCVKRIHHCQTLLAVCGWVLMSAAAMAQDADQQAKDILEKSGVQGGFVVHLNCGDGQLTAALRMNSRYMVQGLSRDAQQVAAARKNVQSQNLYGEVFIDQLQGSQLPYIDNLVSLLVAEDLQGISPDEVQRVLAPRGVAYVKQEGQWTKTVKPVPKDIDDWTHYLHDSSNNAVAHDHQVGPPNRLQWVGSPRYSRHHDRMASMSALVSAQGRLLYIMDEGSRVSIQLPSHWMLIARDAFNGLILWKRPIDTWHSHLWPLKSGPTQLTRRLVAIEDRVYVTLGFAEPLTCLNAATGETIRTYEGTKTTEEIVYSNGTLFLLVNSDQYETSEFAPKLNTGDQGRVAQEYAWNEKPRKVMAVDAETGKVLWSKENMVAPLTLSADDQRVYYYDGEKLFALKRDTGEPAWTSDTLGRRPRFTMNFGPKLVIVDGVVLFAGGDHQMHAFAAQDGKKMWTAPHSQSGYQSPEDLLVLKNVVWSAPTTSGKDTGIFVGRDLKTGEVKSQFSPNVDTYWFHHRCYISKATDNFIIPSRTGIEFVDVMKEDWDIHHWVRGGCLYGVMPCNGLTYAPPHDCACYPEAKVYGMNALAAKSATPLPKVDETNRLVKGPAFDWAQTSQNTNAVGDWPTFRHDNARSGHNDTEVTVDLKNKWATPLGGRLSSLVVSDGKVFVAQIDAHTLHALQEKDGKPVWSFTAGARIDSPPTITRGLALFGSADGWVYCLRAEDGALAWRYRAAPHDRRLMSFEQLESVWPVHGSILVQGDAAFVVSGRSSFLDGGMTMVRLDVRTGQKLSETILDERDPENPGKTLQDRIATLQMPVGLPDILASDGNWVYMRSQNFDMQGNRGQIGPRSGDAAAQGAAQQGEDRHVFAPMGMLDDTWFHRAYWVFGRSFAGGHNGYYQAGKNTPAGRILVHDKDWVYGFGRKPEYLKWTTTIEHQLFSASKEMPVQPPASTGKTGGMVHFEKSPSLNPTGKSLAVEAWAKPEKGDGVIVARGGPAAGYVLYVRNGKAEWAVRTADKLSVVTSPKKLAADWVHLVGVLNEKKLELYVDGKLAASVESAGLLGTDPAQALEIGGDDKGAVGDYKSPHTFNGIIDEVRIYHGPVTAADVAALFAKPSEAKPEKAEAVLAVSFAQGSVRRGQVQDDSGFKNVGTISNASEVAGKFGSALAFSAGKANNQQAGSLVKPRWSGDVPLYVQSLVLTRGILFAAGAPDLINEEETFARLTRRDSKVEAELAEQDAALEGTQGGILWAVSSTDGTKLHEVRLPSLPVWDGLIAARSRLYLATRDGQVICLGK